MKRKECEKRLLVSERMEVSWYRQGQARDSAERRVIIIMALERLRL